MQPEPESRALLVDGNGAVLRNGRSAVHPDGAQTPTEVTHESESRSRMRMCIGCSVMMGLALILIAGGTSVDTNEVRKKFSFRKSSHHFHSKIEVQKKDLAAAEKAAVAAHNATGRACSKPGENCLESRCCEWPGMQCYKKDDAYATCKGACRPGPDMMDFEAKHWTCEKIGSRTPGPIFHAAWETMPTPKWVDGQCSKPGENCSSTKCCSWDGMQCYKKDEDFATCKNECTPGPDLHDIDSVPWTCEKVGPRTPGIGLKLGGDPIADWVLTNCSAMLENCSETKCCKDPGVACYEKGGNWATCKPDCKAGEPDPTENGEIWSCDKLGPSWTVTTTTTTTTKTIGTPSIYCFAVTRSWGAERDIIEGQWKLRIGIFACDFRSVLCSDQIAIGQGHESLPAVRFENAHVGTSKDGTAGNSLLFLHVWNAVNMAGLWQDADFTIKVDPDAVILPDRLRLHFRQYTGARVFVKNCNLFSGDPDYPMMYGAVEALSKAAIFAYMDGKSKCDGVLGWESWGEDLYMQKCLAFLQVQGELDANEVGDKLCGFKGDCNDGSRAAFHPFKDWGSWKACWMQSTGLR